MKRRPKPRPQTLPVCAEFHEDDGVDPRRLFKRESHRDDRKTLQLCKQVLQVLTLVLSGGCQEQVLREVEVQSVQPAPDSSRLQVCVRLPRRVAEISREAVAQALRRAQPWLRAEVAAAITRKRVPDLVFHVRPCEEVNP
jgi:ribosome-binding factor A